MLEERKLVTILFADVTGSTGLGEQLDPEQLRAILQRFFTVMAGVIEGWGGTVEKYAGDAILAVFGVPTAREDDPARALHTALEMQVRLQELNGEFVKRHGIGLQIRIGVNTGEVIAPSSPSGDHQMLVGGDAVNVAARLESAADPGSILVGERTWQLTRHQFRFEPPTALELRGKSAPVEARRLGDALPRGDVADRPIQSPLVGRGHELRALRGVFDEMIENQQPSLAILYGPAGIGKSRLTREFLDEIIVEHPELQILRGRCLAAGQGITFWALAEVLRTCAGIGLDDAVEVASARLGEGVRRVLDPLKLSPDDVRRATFALAATAGLPIASNPLDNMPPEAVDEEMGRAWPLFASGLAQGAPTAIVVEDLHWADDRLVEMLSRTATRAQGPLLLLATARPEFAEAHPGFGTGGGSATAISLRPLTERQGADLVAGLLANAELPLELRTHILQRAEGNPFFVEELIAALIDQGVLVRESGGWRAVAPAGTTLPDTVHAVLAARIDALPAHEKRVLQEAAVFGRTFWPAPLAQQLPDIDVPASLGSLERRGLVIERPTSALLGQVEYLFKHQLIRDVAYAAVPKARRARAHAAVAAWTVELAGERYDEFGELVAFHYHQAASGDGADLAWGDDPVQQEDVRRRAFEALIRAGASARNRFALAAAVELHRQALALATDDAERASAHEQLGDDHIEAFHGDDALAAWQSAVELVRMGPNPAPDVARLAAKVGKLSIRFGTFRGTPPTEVLDRIVQEGLGVAEDLATRTRLLVAFANMSRWWVGTRFGRLLGTNRLDPIPTAQREAAGLEALAAATELDDANLMFFANYAVAESEWSRADYAGYFQRMRDVLPLVDRLDALQDRAELLHSVASSRLEAGDFEQALALSRQCLEVSRPLSAHQMMHASWGVMAAAYALGRWGEVLERFEEHRAAAALEPEVTCAAVRSGPLIGAMVLVQAGDADRARELVPLPDQTSGPPISYAFAGSVLRYAMLLGEQAAARRLILPMVETAEQSVMRIGTLEVVDAIADLEDWAQLDGLLPLFRRVAEGLAALGPIVDRADGRLHAARGEPTRAIERLYAATASFERLRMPIEAARTRELLGGLQPAERSALLEAAAAAYREAGAHALVQRVETALAAA